MRPVECFYFSSKIGLEKWEKRNATVAVLVFLAFEGYIRNSAGSVRVMKKGEDSLFRNKLRSYEKNVLDSIYEKWNFSKVTKVINDFPFGEMFLEEGYLEKNKFRFLPFLKSYSLRPSEECFDLGKKLGKKRKFLLSKIERKELMTAKETISVFSFPSIAFSDNFGRGYFYENMFREDFRRLFPVLGILGTLKFF